MSELIKESKLLAKHSLIYGIGTATNKIVAFLLLPIYTQFLTPHDYGIKELVGLTTDILGTLFATAISSAFYRFYFEYKDEKDRDMVLSSSYLFLGGGGLLFVILLSLATPTFAKYVLDSPALSTYFAVSFISMWFQIINGIGFNYQRAKLQSLQYIILTVLKLLMAIGLNIYFVMYLHKGVMGILISTLISSIVIFFVLNVPQLVRTGFRFSPSIVKEMLIFGFPVIWSQMGAFVVHVSGKFFLKAYTSIADAGIYSLGYRFGTIPGNFISDPFNQVWQPRRLELYKQEKAEEMFGRIFTYFLVFISFVGLGVSVLTKDMLMVISHKNFWSAYAVVPIIVLANTIFSFSNHFNIGLLIEKKTKYLAYINFSNGLFILVLNFLLIPRYGIYGAAYATLIAFIYKSSLTYYLSSKFFKIHFEFRRMAKVFICVCLLYGIAYFIDLSSIYLNIMAKTGVVFLFFPLLYLIDFFSIREKEIFTTVLLPKLKLLIS